MAPPMSVLGIDIAKQVFPVVGMMTPGMWCSGSASRAVHCAHVLRSCPHYALAWRPVGMPTIGPDVSAGTVMRCG